MALNKIGYMNINDLKGREAILKFKPGGGCDFPDVVKEYYGNPTRYKIVGHPIGFVRNDRGTYTCLREV